MKCALLIAAALLPFGCQRPPAATQPIDFSHRAHVEKGLQCGFCHPFVEKAAVAGMPTTGDCMNCHQAAITKSPEEEKVREYSGRGEQIPWQRVYSVAPHVYFSHRRHVALGGIDCADCHGNVSAANEALTAPAVRLDMDGCMSCHLRRQASGDCNACHR